MAAKTLKTEAVETLWTGNRDDTDRKQILYGALHSRAVACLNQQTQIDPLIAFV